MLIVDRSADSSPIEIRILLGNVTLRGSQRLCIESDAHNSIRSSLDGNKLAADGPDAGEACTGTHFTPMCALDKSDVLAVADAGLPADMPIALTVVIGTFWADR
jgi:hypothetical protein